MPGSIPARPWRPVLVAALVVAALDYSYIYVLWVLIRQQSTPERLLQSIATGLLGRPAFDGGWPTALLGGVLHVGVALAWSTLLAVLLTRAPRIAGLARAPAGRVALGAAWGMFVWWSMDLVVLPLSRARPVPVLSSTFAVNTVQHALMVGLPMALIIGGARARAAAGAS